MPAVSKKQQKYFGYLLSNPEERKKKGISKKVAKDFAQDIQEVSPPGWGHTKAEKEKTKPWKPKSKIGGTAAAFKRALDDGRFKGLPGSTTKKEKTADMFKLMWSMKKKGDKPHYKPGTDKKYKKYQDKDEKNESFVLEREDSPYEKASDKALDKKYGYGTSHDKGPKTGFGRASNRSTAAAVLKDIRRRRSKSTSETRADAAHKGWSHTARTSRDQTPEKKETRKKLADTPYKKLPKDEQEKDQVAAHAVKKEYDKQKKKTVKEASAVLDANTKIRNDERKKKLEYLKKLSKAVRRKDYHPFLHDPKESFEIDKSAHKKVQKQKKMRNLALKNTNKNEGDVAHKKAGGPKLYGEALSTKDAKKLNKASVLDQSKDPKDWESARARRTEIDYKDLVRQMKKKRMRNEATTMKDNNLFGNAYAGDKEWKKKNKKAMAHRYKTLHKGDAGGDVNEELSRRNKPSAIKKRKELDAVMDKYDDLKTKIGSKEKHDKPAIKEGISYKDFMSKVYL